MKMTKKFLLGAVAGLAAVMFTGCLPNLGANIITLNENQDGTTGALSTATIDETNDSETECLRGVNRFRIPRSNITAKIIVKNQTDADNNGVMGLLFGGEQNKGKDENGEKLANYNTWNFMLFGVRNENGKIKYYVSHYYNIKEEDFSADNFGAHKEGTETGSENDITKPAYDPDCLTPYEVIIVNTTALSDVTLSDYDKKVFPDLNKQSDNLKLLAVAFALNAQADGSYNLDIYKGEDLEKGGIKEGAEKKAEIKINPKQTNANSTIKATMGCYANVYAQQTLTGEWQIWDISTGKGDEANPVLIQNEWADSLEANPIIK